MLSVPTNADERSAANAYIVAYLVAFLVTYTATRQLCSWW